MPYKHSYRVGRVYTLSSTVEREVVEGCILDPFCAISKPASEGIETS